MTLQLRPTFSESWYRVAPLKPKLRAGAQISRQFYRGERWYVVRDPAGNQYHRLSDAAYKFVGLLDGQRTIGEAWELVGGQLADDAPTQPEVIQILSQLYSANLIETNISPDATVLLRRHKRMMMHKAKGRLMNLLFPRIPLWDLDWFLKTWMPVLRPMLSFVGLMIWIGVVVTACVLLAPNWDTLWQQGKESVNLYANPLNAFWLYVAFAFIKFIHELGHGFMCRRFGGEVHELGIMFLVLFPAPYVDASSAWSFPNKWHRVLVGAGGMIFELFVAALCAFAWLAVKDSNSDLRLFLYNIMLIASFSTIVFNANPLLRYDGYYILSDILEIPNLQHRSREYSLSLLKRHLFRVKWSQPLPAPNQRPWLLAYFLTSGPYRVMVGLFIMIMVLFQLPEQVKFLGMIMGLGSLATFFVVPAYKSFTYLTIEPELHRKRGIAWAWTIAFLAACTILLGFINFPLNVRAEAIIEPEKVQNVVAAYPGFISEIRKHDKDLVKAGDVLVVLTNDEIDKEVVMAEADVVGRRVDLTAAEARGPVDANQARAALAVAEKRLAVAKFQKEQLTIRATQDGQFVAPTLAQSVGRFLRPDDQQQLPMRVIQADQLVGYALIDQKEVEILREAEYRANKDKSNGYKTEVRLVSDLRPASILHPLPKEEGSNIQRVSLLPAASNQVRSPILTQAGGGPSIVDPRDPSGTKTKDAEFAFEIRLNNPNGTIQPYQRAYVRIQIDEGRSILWQGWRRLNQLIQTTATS